MADSMIKFKRGNKVENVKGEVGEPLVTNDTKELYLGKGSVIDAEIANIGYHNQEQLIHKLDAIEDAKDANLLRLSKSVFLMNAQTDAQIKGMDTMIADDFQDGNGVQTFDHTRIGSWYIDSAAYNTGYLSGIGAVNLAGGTSPTNSFARTYRTTQGFDFKLGNHSQITAITTFLGNFTNLFDGDLTGDSNGAFVIGVNGAGTLIEADFTSTGYPNGIDIYSVYLHYRAVAYTDFSQGNLTWLENGLDDLPANYDSSPYGYSTFAAGDGLPAAINILNPNTNKYISKIKINGLDMPGTSINHGFREFRITKATSSATMKAQSTTTPPKAMILYVDETVSGGSISYEVSVNGGVNWEPITKETLFYPSTVGYSVQLKVNFTNDAQLKSYCLAWV